MDYRPGTYLRDHRRLQIPPDLDHAVLRVGLYDPSSLERSPIVAKDGAALGDALLVATVARR